MAMPSETTMVEETPNIRPADETIAEDAQALSAQLKAMRDRLFSPTSRKSLRSFTSGEAARLIGVSDGYLRQISLAGEGPELPTGPGEEPPSQPPIPGLEPDLPALTEAERLEQRGQQRLLE